ncbi:hypothetical protein JHK82_047346 [Glycine max]|nr:hypothetical protein JHK85_047817 [Glycine max]KAG5097492.1 hypothetical protein JHK82_047346 [Glycine max]KAG5102281.1 hypothetical protein JHK84_047250 [Glycine max]
MVYSPSCSVSWRYSWLSFCPVELMSLERKKGGEVEGKRGKEPICIYDDHLSTKTFILGFRKGGTVLNQIVTELGFSDIGFNVNSPGVGHPKDRKFSSSEEIYAVPETKEGLLNNISERFIMLMLV